MTRASLCHTMNHRDLMGLFRSSHQICSVEKCVLKIFANFPGKAGFFKSVAGRNIICERLLLFVSPENTITNSSGEFGLDETWTQCKVKYFLKRAEAAGRRCSLKKVVLEILENSQVNSCARIFFNKVAVEHLWWLLLFNQMQPG